MKRSVLAVALLPLAFLAGCDSTPKEEAAANAQMVAGDIEARANALEAQAFNATLPIEEPPAANTSDVTIDNQADTAR